jgi:hypothetical protein
MGFFVLFDGVLVFGFGFVEFLYLVIQFGDIGFQLLNFVIFVSE